MLYFAAAMMKNFELLAQLVQSAALTGQRPSVQVRHSSHTVINYERGESNT